MILRSSPPIICTEHQSQRLAHCALDLLHFVISRNIQLIPSRNPLLTLGHAANEVSGHIQYISRLFSAAHIYKVVCAARSAGEYAGSRIRPVGLSPAGCWYSVLSSISSTLCTLLKQADKSC